MLGIRNEAMPSYTGSVDVLRDAPSAWSLGVIGIFEVMLVAFYHCLGELLT